MAAPAPAAPAAAPAAGAPAAATPAAAKPVIRHKVANLQSKPNKIQAAWNAANKANAADNKFTGQSVSIIAQHTVKTLKSTDIDGQSDPYFIFQLDNFKDVACRTAYQASTLNPSKYFDRKSPVRFPLTPANLALLKKGELLIHVEVWDADLTYDDLMGAGSFNLPKPKGAENETTTFEAPIKDGKQRDAGTLLFYVFYDLEGKVPQDKDKKDTDLQFLWADGVTPKGLKSEEEFKKEAPKVEEKKVEKQDDKKDQKKAECVKNPLDACESRVKYQDIVKKTGGKVAKKAKDLATENEKQLKNAATALGKAETDKKATPELYAAAPANPAATLSLCSIKTHAVLEDPTNPKKSKVKEGAKLAAKDTDGWSDPYFFVAFNNHAAVWRTATVDNSLTPEYVYNVDKDGKAAAADAIPTWKLTTADVKALQEGTFVCHVEAWDEDVTYDDQIGWTNSRVKLEAGKNDIVIHKQLLDGTHPAGEIKVHLRYELAPAAAPAAPAPAPAAKK